MQGPVELRGLREQEVAAISRTLKATAKELNVPIGPVCIRGAFEALPRGSAFMRPKHIEVKFLPAVKPTESDSYEDLTRQTQDAIEALLAH